MEILEFKQRIVALKDDLVSAVRSATPGGLNTLPQTFTAHIKLDGTIISLSVSGVLLDQSVYLVGTRIPDGKKLILKDDQLDCETLMDVLMRMRTRGDFPDGSELLPETFSEEDDVGKLLKMLVGVQKYYLRLQTKDGLREFGPYRGGDKLGLKLGLINGTTAAYRLDSDPKWNDINIEF
ncbi:MAG: hypothetical protein H7343_07855 [Undibacterium sp.]|nr:hypothetical protein [Opitutaceae bacterium]